MSHLLPESRRAQIVDELRLRGMLRVTELSKILGVAAVTIRRDINHLADEGLVRRVHGGAAIDPPGLDGPAVVDSSVAVPDPVVARTVGMLVPSLDYYWPEIIAGAQEQAKESGLRIMLRGTSYESTDDRAQVTHLINSGVDGVILAPDTTLPGTGEMLEWLKRAEVPVVLVEREWVGADHLPFESVKTDHLTGAMSAVGHLAGLGHRRVGYVASRKSPHAEEIRRGWREAVASLGLEADGVDRAIDQPGVAGTDPAIEELIQACLDTGTSALLVHADREAIAIVQHCQTRDLQIPEDLSIIAYDDEVAGLFSPALTAVRPPRMSIGKAAVALMVERLKDSELPAHRMVVTPKLSVRDSVAPPRVPTD